MRRKAERVPVLHFHFGVVMEVPSQDALDTVALFVVAARQLKTCRFWMEEHQNLTCIVEQSKGTPKVSYRLPDPETVAAAVLAFRKLWNEEDACHHGKAKNVIYKHCPRLQHIIDESWQHTHGMLEFLSRQHRLDVATKDIVTVWLNTQFLHVGKGRRRGRFTREDFQKMEAAIGASRFEYCFLMCMWHYGIYFRNLFNIAEAFLRWCGSTGLSPSVDITPQGPAVDVQRATPGFQQHGSPAEQLCWRLRRMRKYRAFADVAEQLGLTDTSMATHISGSDTFSCFCQSLDVTLVREQAPPLLESRDGVYFGSMVDEPSPCIQLGRVRKGFWQLTRDRRIRWSDEWLAVVEEQYASVRGELKGLLG